ncbi:MAG: hypothetical protein ACI85K_001929 [Hyphomicrobiaceae bacterium]|jgi:uncharacterized protein (TIRG00374 family)
MAMNKHVITLIKIALLMLMFWWVFTTINFHDRLNYKANKASKKIVAEVVITIQGHWKTEPVVYTINDPKNADDAGVKTASRGVQDDERYLEVAPGIFSYWGNLDPMLFALGALCYFLTVIIAGIRWWWLLRAIGTDVSLFETLRFTWIGVFFNAVMLGSTGGDVIKALYIMKRCPGHRVPVLVSVGVDRILGLGSLALLGAFAVLFASDKFNSLALGIWGVIAAVGLLGLIAFSKRLRERVHLTSLLNRVPAKFRGKLQMVDQAIFFYRDQRTMLLGSLALGIANHVLSVCCVVLIGMAIGVGMPVFEYFVLVPVINIASAVPIAPNGWGIGETMYGHLFGTHGQQYMADSVGAFQAMYTRGVALSVLYRTVLTGFSLLAGVLVFFEKDRVTQDDIDREVATEEQEQEDAASAPPGT